PRSPMSTEAVRRHTLKHEESMAGKNKNAVKFARIFGASQWSARITCHNHGRIPRGRERMNMKKICIVGATGRLAVLPRQAAYQP
ncbi:MAG: hypothetical protein KAH97_02925, partial [Anaerolineales bacterium]|nr:hypothetical protein [Anaerolineales bacterium]